MFSSFRFLPVFLCGLLPLAVSALTVEVSYEYDTGGFFDEQTTNGAAARASMKAAAQFYSDILTDSLSPIESNVETNDNYEINFIHPSGFSSVTIPFLQLPKDTVRIYVGARNLGSDLAFAGTGTPSQSYPAASISGNSEFVKTAAFRGQDFGTESQPRPEIAPWGGHITFNNRTDGLRGFWNYDHTIPPSFNNDLYSTALHELGHIFGVGIAQSYKSFIPNGTATFTGPRTTYFNSGQPLQLTGNIDHVGDEDLETELHPYALGQGTQVSAFLASRPFRVRRHLTLLDTAILDDIGWDVNYLVAVPEPSSAALSLSALALLAMRRRRA